jgi:hypothetical protein
LLLAGLVAGALLAAAPARADLPPPDGVKFVGFSFTVADVAKHADWVLVAYPWSGSGGAPTLEHWKIAEGQKVPVGRRSGIVKLWQVGRADYEAFAATYEPTRSWEDEPLKAFFETSGKAKLCDGAPDVTTQLPKDDPRSEVVQAMRVTQMGDTGCKVIRIEGASPESGDDASSPSSPASPSPTPASPKSSGCGGCATAPTPDGASAGLGAAAALALGIARVSGRWRARRSPAPAR